MKNSFFALLVLFSLLISPSVYAIDDLVIKGKITADPSTSLDQAQIILSEITMQQQMNIVPIKMVNPKKDGSYIFKIKKPTQQSFYRLSASYKERTTGSNPFRFIPGQSPDVIEVNMELPVVTTDASGLRITKKVVFFELLSDAIRVTEALHFENGTNGIIDIRANPIRIALPQEAIDPFFKQNYTEFNVRFQDGEALFELLVPQGRNQVYYQYELPASDKNLNFASSIPQGTEKLELISNHKDLKVEVEDAGLKYKARDEWRDFNKSKLRVVVLKLDGKTGEIGLLLENNIVPQKKMLYPATLLLIILLSGLFWYVKIKQNKTFLPKKKAF